MTTILRGTISALAAIGLAGCGTSREARELATETAAAVQALDVAISTNAAEARKAAAGADARIANLIRRTADQQADLQMRIDASDSAKQQFDRLRQFADRHETDRQKAINDASAEAKALTDARQSAKPVSPALREVSDKLGVLGKEESLLERVRGTVGFVREVAKRVKDDGKAAQDAAKGASAEAKKETEKSDAEKFKN
jgi:hypothetical protein